MTFCKLSWQSQVRPETPRGLHICSIAHRVEVNRKTYRKNRTQRWEWERNYSFLFFFLSLSLSLFLFILFNFRDGLKYENFQSECLCQTKGKLAFLRTDRDLKKSVSAVLLLGQRSYFCWIANSRRVYRHLVIIEHGVSADKRERKQKKTPIFTFKKFPRPLKRECPLTGMCTSLTGRQNNNRKKSLYVELSA